jgi:hypothetical protein
MSKSIPFYNPQFLSTAGAHLNDFSLFTFFLFTQIYYDLNQCVSKTRNSSNV